MNKKRAKFNTRKRRISYKLDCVSENRIKILYNKSNKYISLQAIDPENGSTILSISTCSNAYFKDYKNRNSVKIAAELGKHFAKSLKQDAKYKDLNAYFDRGGFHYHGKAASCANSLRNNGLKF